MEYINEQIIIDSCKIEECVNFRDEVSIGSTVLKNACSIGLWQRHYKNLEESCKMSCKCDENPNCYFKQQARKTQECEELKERVTIAEDNFACEIQARLYHQNEWLKFSKEADRYRKALEEIEKEVHDEMCDTLGHLCAYCDGKHSCITLKILDIINQAKGKNNG